MDDHRAALVRTRSRVYVRLAVEMGLLSEPDARAVLAAQERDLAQGRVSFITRTLVDLGYLSREDADRVRERQEKVSLICEKCLAVYRVEGKSPGTRLACKCGNTLVVQSFAEAGETGETVLARQQETGDRQPSTANREPITGAVARLLSTRRFPPPVALPRVRAALARAGLARYVEEAPYRWLDADLGRLLAVRTLSPQDAAIPAVRARFLAEARLAGQLEHPAILPVHDVLLSPGGAPCYTTPSLAGKSLEEAAPGLAIPALLRAIRRVAEALDYAGDHGVLHLAVSPRSIVIEETGAVYLLDWSAARVQAKLEPESGSDSGVHPLPEKGPGATPYTSPEQASGKPLDRRADVYSLGATLAFGLTGKPPSRAAAVSRLSGVPRGLSAIVAKAMARKRRDRYATSGELAADLARFERGLPLAARRDPFLVKTLRFFRRRPRLAAACVASFLGLSALGVVLATMAYQERLAEEDRVATAEKTRVEAWDRNVKDAAKLGEDEASLRKALAHARLATEHARSENEREAAGRALAKVHLGLARLAIEASGEPILPVSEALEHVRIAAQAPGSPALAGEIESVRREAQGRAWFRVETEPPGGSVAVHRLGRDSVEPGELAAEGASGDVFDLPLGRYLVLARGARTLEVRLPVYLERGFEENRDVLLPLPESAPEGFVYVPAGWAKLGEKAERKFIDHGFFISKIELTWREYEEFLAAMGSSRGRYEPHSWSAGNVQEVVPASERRPDYPVLGVSHDDLAAYCEWRSGRDRDSTYELPSPEEWEWAARGADGREHPWGDAPPGARANLRGSRTSFSFSDIEPSAARPDDLSVFGCYEMAGNLREWTSRQVGENSFEIRGGCWGSPDIEGRCWFSGAIASDDRNGGVGSRLVAVPRTR